MNQRQNATQAVQSLTGAAHRGDREAIEALRDVALHAIAALESLTSAPAGHPDIPEPIRAGVAAAQDVAARSLQWPVRWDAIQEIRESHLGKVSKDAIGRVGGRGIGTKSGIRVNKKSGQKKPRDFGPHGISGFGLDVWQELESARVDPNRRPHIADIHHELAAPGVLTAEQLRRDWKELSAMLEPLAVDTLEAWVDAGAKLCEAWAEEWDMDEHPTIPTLQRMTKTPHWNRFPWINPIRRKAGERQETLDGHTTARGIRASIRGKIRESLTSLLA
jgi:hypothetical protein